MHTLTKLSADTKALTYFEEEHRKMIAFELERRIDVAKSGDDWMLGQLHMESITDSETDKRLSVEPELLSRLTSKR